MFALDGRSLPLCTGLHLLTVLHCTSRLRGHHRSVMDEGSMPWCVSKGGRWPFIRIDGRLSLQEERMRSWYRFKHASRALRPGACPCEEGPHISTVGLLTCPWDEIRLEAGRVGMGWRVRLHALSSLHSALYFVFLLFLLRSIRTCLSFGFVFHRVRWTSKTNRRVLVGCPPFPWVGFLRVSILDGSGLVSPPSVGCMDSKGGFSMVQKERCWVRKGEEKGRRKTVSIEWAMETETERTFDLDAHVPHTPWPWKKTCTTCLVCNPMPKTPK